MSVYHLPFETARGDSILVTLFCHADEPASMLFTILDADQTDIPTAELSLPEVGRFRDELRRLCEQGEKPGVRQR